MAGDKVQTAGQCASATATASLVASLGIGGIGERDACVERPAITPNCSALNWFSNESVSCRSMGNRERIINPVPEMDSIMKYVNATV